MRGLLLLGLFAALARAQVDERLAPWHRAVREEAFYRTCQSSCTEYSQGTMTKVELCDDTEVCRGKKISLDEYATKQCTGWVDAIQTMNLTGKGRRFKYEPTIASWLSCAMFCENDRGQWYSPRGEFGRGAFFPDGTWCHRSNGNDFYCQKNLCLPEGYVIDDAIRIADSLLGTESDSILIDNSVIDVV